MTAPDDPRLQGLDFPTPTSPPHERMRAAAARLERAMTVAIPFAPPMLFAVRNIVTLLRSSADQHVHPSSACKGCRMETFADILLGER